jgi:hypothetical protein
MIWEYFFLVGCIKRSKEEGPESPRLIIIFPQKRKFRAFAKCNVKEFY